MYITGPCVNHYSIYHCSASPAASVSQSTPGHKRRVISRVVSPPRPAIMIQRLDAVYTRTRWCGESAPCIKPIGRCRLDRQQKQVEHVRWRAALLSVTTPARQPWRATTTAQSTTAFYRPADVRHPLTPSSPSLPFPLALEAAPIIQLRGLGERCK